MMEAPALSVVIPSYNEAENLRVVLPELLRCLNTLGVTHEVLIVDTREPTDDTAEVCAANQVAYCRRERSNHYGSAIRTGIAKAQGERVLIMDADGTHNPAAISGMMYQAPDYDVVIASRYVKGGSSENNLALRVMSRMLNGTFRKLLGMPVGDMSTSFKLYRRTQLQALTLECDNFDVLQEILFKLIHANPGLRIKEVPVVVEKRIHGKTKRNYATFLVSYVRTLVRLRLAGLKG